MVAWFDEDKTLHSKRCECMDRRVSLRRIRQSGMEELLDRFTFDSYQTPDAKRLKTKTLAKQYADSDEGWFYIGGQQGGGKTHICTAICARLIERGVDVYYMPWRDESMALKACVTDAAEYESRIHGLKHVRVLYIDDLFKGGSSEADVRLAVEIINARCYRKSLRTVISSELSMEQLAQIDESLGSKIYEHAEGYRLTAPPENWRLK